MTQKELMFVRADVLCMDFAATEVLNSGVLPDVMEEIWTKT